MATLSPTHRFRRQHGELGDLAKTLVGLVADEAALARDPSAARRALSALTGKLKVHAAMEDEALYPRLLVHSNGELREAAKRIHDSFGGIYAAFSTYSEEWPSSKIEASPRAFAQATRETMRVLASRIQLENDELYALVDRVEATEL